MKSSLKIIAALFTSSATHLFAQELDNSSLIPPILPDSEVTMEGLSPDWVKELIIAECRIETASPEGTFAGAIKLLDHYASMGVNGLWITPIWERGSIGNGYVNFGCHTIEPLLTGASDLEGSFTEVKKFVDEAHQRNIRVFFDIIVWGVNQEAPLLQSHPDFFTQRAVNGQPKYLFDWKKDAVKSWFTDAAVLFVEKTGADGFRVDLAPHTSGYFFRQVRDALHGKGHKVAIFSEGMNDRRDTFDFEQLGVSGWLEEPDYANIENYQAQKKRFGKHHDFLLNNNIVDAVKTGRGIGKPSLQIPGQGSPFRYYTSNLLNHDDRDPFVQGNRVRMGYTAIFAPFIPMWWIGEEWDNPRHLLTNQRTTGVIYFNTIDWDLLSVDHHRSFLEDVKRFIRIRRSYPEIFTYFPPHTRDANIAKVASSRDGQPNPLQAYARFANNRAILVVPNYQPPEGSSPSLEITPDYSSLGLSSSASYVITDLLTDQLIAEGRLASLSPLTVDIPPDHLGLYLVSPK